MEINKNNGWGKPAPIRVAVSTLRVLEGVTPSEAILMYDNINATANTKCGASTPFMRSDGKYDVWFYVTTYVPRGSVLDKDSQTNMEQKE